jgi:hypothetical protein
MHMSARKIRVGNKTVGWGIKSPAPLQRAGADQCLDDGLDILTGQDPPDELGETRTSGSQR